LESDEIIRFDIRLSKPTLVCITNRFTFYSEVKRKLVDRVIFLVGINSRHSKTVNAVVSVTRKFWKLGEPLWLSGKV
jgi:hypothetical protein